MFGSGRSVGWGVVLGLGLGFECVSICVLAYLVVFCVPVDDALESMFVIPMRICVCIYAFSVVGVLKFLRRLGASF